MFNIALSWPVNQDELRKLQGYVSDVCRILSPKSYHIQDLLTVAPDADAIVGGYIPEQMIEQAPNVQLVQVLHSGVTHRSIVGADLGFSFNTLRARNILLGNIAGANAVAVAEMAFAQTMALAKRILPAHRAIAQGSWYPYTRDTMGCASWLGKLWESLAWALSVRNSRRGPAPSGCAFWLPSGPQPPTSLKS